MYVIAKLVAVHVCLYQFVRKILRMGCHKPDPLQSVNRVDPVDQICEIPPSAFCILTLIGIDVLPQQSHFPHAVAHQSLDLLQDILGSTALFPSSRIRHDTVCAKVVAAVHDIDERLVLIQPLCRKALCDMTGVCKHFHNGILLHVGPL